MAILDETLAEISDAIAAGPHGQLVPRQRGGIARNSVHWAERSGRLASGGWAELRLHHRPSEQMLQAGLLIYLPLSRGGRTQVIGERSLVYRDHPNEVAAELAEDIVTWLASLTEAGAATRGG